jgi:radical SAM superfamily enzyme YgiQ (UPF0313 family)
MSVKHWQDIKKIAFVNPYPYYAKGTNEATLYPPLGLAYLCSVLEKYNIECRIIEGAAYRLTPAEIYRQIREFKPDAVGITSNIITARAAIELGIGIKKRFPHQPLLFGGPYATAEDEHILKQTRADVVVRGEGEATIVDFVRNIREISSVKGITYRKGNHIIRNPQRELIEDLDSIPFPAYHLLPDFRYYRSRSRREPIGFLLSSRGCPYGCIYCNKNIFGKRFRMRSASNVLTEIELLVGRYKVKQIDILDDNFTLNVAQAEKIFSEVIKRKIGVLFNFQNGIRADRLTPRLVRTMKQAGVYKTGIGIESGDPEIQKIIKKSLSLVKVKRAVKMLRREGIIVVGFFMIGIPGENRTSIEKTIRFAVEVNPHMANFSIVVPLPQTELFEIVRKGGKFLTPIHEGSDTGYYSGDFSFEYGDLNPEFIRKYAAYAYRKFYFRPSKIIDILTSIKSLGELRWIFDTAKPLLRFLCT